MSIKAKTERVAKGEYVATIGDVREYGTSAVDAALNAERIALGACGWVTPVVECVPSAGVVLVAYQNAGRFCYDVIDIASNHKRCSTQTGDCFSECVSLMMRHAAAYAADALVSA